MQDTKSPEDCVWALELLRRWGFQARLDFVGSLDYLGRPGRQASRVDRSPRPGAIYVAFAEGFVPEQTYQDYLVGSDLAIQLRTYGFGSLSGALLDCAAAGLRSVSNASMAEAVGAPTSYVRSIPNAISAVLLAEALADLIESGPSAAELENDRADFSDERSFQPLCGALVRNVLEL